jgi:hypothetical protein
MTHAEFTAHRANGCRFAAKPSHVGGPDIRWVARGTTIVGDVTVVNLLTAAHHDQSLDSAFLQARLGKLQKYGALCAARGVQLLTLALTSNGVLSPEVIRLSNDIADRTFRDRTTVRNELSAAAAHGSAVARLAAEEAAGIRPPSIHMESVKLPERFRVQPIQLQPEVQHQQASLRGVGIHRTRTSRSNSSLPSPSRMPSARSCQRWRQLWSPGLCNCKKKKDAVAARKLSPKDAS